MRKVALALAAAALLLSAGSFAWKADATILGTPDFAKAAKAYSPVGQIACRYDAFCKPGYVMVCRLFDCWCARCSKLYR
ncbi:MAG TPA: hypothetical protein VLD66_05935 [Methyloceanibacter sp.]|jgi:hypothetical protein|nr:hypothetical protein [Methyloceanibacter sp.]